ncbi:MAG: S8 family serine peptidase, partial [Bacteroidota bacterium]
TMKKTLFFLFVICSLKLYAQEPLFVNLPKDSVVRLDSRMQQFEYVPGEILIRYKDEAAVSNLKLAGIAQTGIASVDQIFQKYNVNQSERLFPLETKLKSKVMLKAFNGKEFEQPSLHNIYKLTLPMESSLILAIEELKQDPNVVYAEPNYILSITNDKAVSPIMSESEFSELASSVPSLQLPVSSPANPSEPKSTPNDPLYSQQGYINMIHAEAVWDSVNGKDSTQVIAIIDTGIDWLHPDLSPNIWINSGEIPGNGLDDDANGKTDDVRGWDWINNDNNPQDDNGHGTHVAGIAAARGNNGIGITGISPRAKIMAIKVFTNQGGGDAATISQGIEYAASNGATILNMSFGGYSRSFTMENALLNAYLTCDLVAGAGNNSKSIYPENSSDFPTCYPAALSYVLGVEASDADFSNYDPDGPIYSEFEEGFNYELKAPGSGLLSTFRNGVYKTMSGTSMAAPCVSGAISLYKSQFPNKSREDLWADMIYNSSGSINIQQAMFNSIKYPVFDLMESHVVDTLPGDDRDGQADAGETIQIWVKIRNTFGFADSAYVKIQQSIYGDTNDVHIVHDSSFLGSMAAFGALTNKLIPFKVLINTNAANDRNITLDVLMKNKSDTATFSRPINFKIYNGQELSGVITQDIVLTPDKLWLINNSLRLSAGVTITILPGTHVQINAGVDNRGHVHAEGTSDSLVFIEGNFGGNIFYKYAEINLKGGGLSATGNVENCNISNGAGISVGNLINCKLKNFNFNNAAQVDSIRNCYIQDFVMPWTIFQNVRSCVFDNLIIKGVTGNERSKYAVFTKITNIYKYIYPNWPAVWYENPASLFGGVDNNSENRLWKNTLLFNDVATTFVTAVGGADIVTFNHQYWGTTDSLKIKPKYIDFWNNAGLPFLNYKPLMTAPSDSCPGHVWRVLINGHDAQDEILDPVGIGNLHFAVCFNKAMDTTITPALSFGLRFPYLQHLVSDSAHWSADHKTWNAVFNVKLYTGDGINRIRVAAAKAQGDFAIPLEDQRFNFIIQAAGTVSVDFLAQPGIGKVYLEWNNAGIPDLLGFNLYRFYNLTDTTYSQPVMINSSLIADTTYTDFAVTPGVHYWYYYKVVNTDFRESDSSNLVNAIPYNASLGDVNGDGQVNVLDVTALVACMLGQNPQPFLFDAADVNDDNTINILDVIGVVNI